MCQGARVECILTNHRGSTCGAPHPTHPQTRRGWLGLDGVFPLCSSCAPGGTGYGDRSSGLGVKGLKSRLLGLVPPWTPSPKAGEGWPGEARPSSSCGSFCRVVSSRVARGAGWSSPQSQAGVNGASGSEALSSSLPWKVCLRSSTFPLLRSQ